MNGVGWDCGGSRGWRNIEFGLGRLKTLDPEQPRLARLRRREARVTGFLWLQDAAIATFGLEPAESARCRPEAVLDYNGVVRAEWRGNWSKEEEPKPVVCRANLVVAEQIDLRSIEWGEC